jgi:C4-dicarboxylate-specific signal transduction histidine kinase
MNLPKAVCVSDLKMSSEQIRMKQRNILINLLTNALGATSPQATHVYAAMTLAASEFLLPSSIIL